MSASATGYMYLVEDGTKEKLDGDKKHSASAAYDILCSGTKQSDNVSCGLHALSLWDVLVKQCKVQFNVGVDAADLLASVKDFLKSKDENVPNNLENLKSESTLEVVSPALADMFGCEILSVDPNHIITKLKSPENKKEAPLYVGLAKDILLIR